MTLALILWLLTSLALGGAWAIAALRIEHAREKAQRGGVGGGGVRISHHGSPIA